MKVFAELAKRLEAGESVVLVTVLREEGSSPRKRSARMLVHPDGSITGTIGGGAVEHRVVEKALAAFKAHAPEIYRVHLTRELGMCCGGAMEFLIEPIEAAPRLVIFGAGHVGQALCPIASSAGFLVTIVDEREEYMTQERFPEAERLIVNAPIDALSGLELSQEDYIVLITHDHRLDEELLRRLVKYPLTYLGMIGSRSKVARFLRRLEARGLSRAVLDKVRMPVGLDLGAVTPGELAVSITAELIAIRRGHAQEVCRFMYWRPGNDVEADFLLKEEAALGREKAGSVVPESR